MPVTCFVCANVNNLSMLKRNVERLQDGSDPVRAAQAAAAKALSGSHGSGGSLTRTSSSNSLSGRLLRQRDAPGAATASAPAVRPPSVAAHSSPAEPTPATDPTEGSEAGVTLGATAEAPAVNEASKPAPMEGQATDTESKAGAASASEEPEAPAMPSLEAEKVP